MLKHLNLLAAIAVGVAVAGCSTGGKSGMSLLLENEKKLFQKTMAEKIGSSPEEIQRAFDSSEAGDRKRARQITKQMVARLGKSGDKAMQAHLQTITNRLGKAIGADAGDYEVTLVKDQQINAFTPGGGIIIVHEGLLSFMDTESEVAAVLAHEMAHVLQKHPHRMRQFRLAGKAGGTLMDAITPEPLEGIGKVFKLGGKASVNAAIRAQEAEADSIAIDILVASGYDPHGMVRVQRQLMTFVPQAPRLLNILYGQHPLSKDREVAAARKIRTSYPGVSGDVSSKAFAKLIRSYQERRMKQLAAKL